MYCNKDTDIAIIGMAGKFPGAQNIDEFWENLKNGVESIRFFSDDELMESGISKTLLKNKNYIKAKGYLNHTDCFDSPFFGYTLKEATQMHPQTRLFHECVYLALEDAGYSRLNTRTKVGIFAGASCDESWRKQFAVQENNNMASHFNDELLLNKDFMCSNVAYKLGLKGPCYIVNTACSSSLAAIHIACQSILNDDCDMAVAGGASITFPAKNGYIYEEGMVNSPDGHCCPFDRNAKGTIEGNGVGAVVLKRLSRAVKDKDIIYAVMRSSAVNNDGNNKLNFTAPSFWGIESAMKDAYAKASININNLKYIELHGTGTPLGDAVELAALKSALHELGNPNCTIGSVKANIGHLDAAAGIAGFIKTVLILYYKQIPPVINFNTPNDELTMDNGMFFINTSITDIDAESPICAGVNSFGQGGSNVHVVLESFNNTEMAAQSEAKETHLMLFSAKTKQSLQNYINTFCDYINSQNKINLGDVAFHLAITKNHYSYRAFLVAQTGDEIKTDKLNIIKDEKNARPGIALICDGNILFNKKAIQWFYTHYSSFASHIDRFIGIENLLNTTDIEERNKVVILTGVLLLVEEFGIQVDCVVGCGVGILALMNFIADIPMEDLFGNNELYNIRDKKIPCRYPIYDPISHTFVDEIGFDAVQACYNMKIVPDCTNHFINNTIFVHVNGKQLITAGRLYSSQAENEIAYEQCSIETVVGNLWANGRFSRLEKIFSGKHHKKVHLPGYSFDKIKLDVSSLSFKKEANENNTFYYHLDWKLEPYSASATIENELVLIFVPTEYVNETNQYFESMGYDFIIAEMGDTFCKESENHFIFNPEEASHYVYLFHNIFKKNGAIHFIINLMPLSLNILFHELGSKDMLNLNIFRLRCILLAISKYESNAEVVISNITENLYNLQNPSKTNFSFAGLFGIQQVIEKEYMNLKCINVDFNELNHLSVPFFDYVLKEITNKHPQNTVVYDHNYRFVSEFNQLKEWNSLSRIVEDGVYVILGGTGRIGRVIADFITHTVNCTIIITGLNKIHHNGFLSVEDYQFIDSVDEDLYHALKKLLINGSKILISRVDVLNQSDVSHFFAGIYRKFKKINGIINCVGNTDSRYNQIIEDSHLKELNQQLLLRQKGLIILDNILEQYEYDFCLLFSSVASLLGGLGQFGYAGACSFMDQYVKTRNSIKKKKWEVINIDTWITQSGLKNPYHLIPRQILHSILSKIFQKKYTNEYIITNTDIHNYITKNNELIKKYNSNTEPVSEQNLRQIMIKIWSVLFGREVTADEKFFDIGGDSLKALEMISNIRSELNVRVKLKDLYHYQTINRLVHLIEGKTCTTLTEVKPQPVKEQQKYYECSFAQKEMFLPHNQIYPTRYNLSGVFMLNGDIDLAQLNTALNHLVKRHEICRTSFLPIQGRYRQIIHNEVKLAMKHKYTDDLSAAIDAFIVAFDTSAVPLLKMQLVTDRKDGNQYLLVDMHHAIFDEQSIQLFLRELLYLYTDHVINEDVKQFKEYSCKQYQNYCDGAYLLYQSFWLEKKKNYRYTKLIPDKSSTICTYGKTNCVLIEREQHSRYTQLALRSNMSLASFVLSIWMLVISHFVSHVKISVGLRVKNRLNEYKTAMGCFLEKVVLMMEINNNMSLTKYLESFEMEYSKTLENSFYPYYLLTQDYQKDKLFSILFNYIVLENQTISSGGIELTPFHYEPKTLYSKYDFNFRILDDKQQVSCSLKYMSSSYSEEYVARMFALFKTIANNMLNNADETIQTLFETI